MHWTLCSAVLQNSALSPPGRCCARPNVAQSRCVLGDVFAQMLHRNGAPRTTNTNLPSLPSYTIHPLGVFCFKNNGAGRRTFGEREASEATCFVTFGRATRLLTTFGRARKRLGGPRTLFCNTALRKVQCMQCPCQLVEKLTLQSDEHAKTNVTKQISSTLRGSTVYST